MRIIPIGRNSFIILQIKRNEVVVYTIYQGQVVDRAVVAVLPGQPRFEAVALIALIKAILATLAVMAFLLGYQDLAEFIAKMVGAGGG